MASQKDELNNADAASSHVDEKAAPAVSATPATPATPSARTARTAIDQASSPMPFEPGVVIHDKYELVRPLGSGGVGCVVAARHIGFDDLVALKFLRPEFATHEEAVSRFTIEARASFKLRSEHVARMLDVDIYEGVPFIAMELLEGTDLRNLLEARRVLAVEPAVDYLLQACEALAAAHALGVIHRDIKPENLFLLGDGDAKDHLKVLDFGISKVSVRGEDRRTLRALTRIAVGTPPYMSPEQVRASSALDARSDIWSAGCVLYELLTGTAPFERVSMMQACAAVLEDQPASPHELRPDLPSELCSVIMHCLEKDPEQRFPDVAAFAEALSPFGSGRFAGYPARCRAHLLGEGLGRRSTPTGFSLGRTTQSTHSHHSPNAQARASRLSVEVPRDSHAPSSSRRVSITAANAYPLSGAVSGTVSGKIASPSASAFRAATVQSGQQAQPAPTMEQSVRAEASAEVVAQTSAPRRRVVQVAAWSLPIVFGGLLATYLATAEQHARSAQGPSLRSISTSSSTSRLTEELAQGSAEVDVADAPAPDVINANNATTNTAAATDPLPVGREDDRGLAAELPKHVDGMTPAERMKLQAEDGTLAQATGGTPREARHAPEADSDDAPEAAAAARTLHTASKRTPTSSRSSESKTKSRWSRSTSTATQRTEQTPTAASSTTKSAAPLQRPSSLASTSSTSDPDVGF